MRASTKSQVKWPSRQPYALYAAFVLAALFFVLACMWQFQHQWNSLQRLYLQEYVMTWLHPREPAQDFYVLNLIGRHGLERLALGNEITARRARDGSVLYQMLGPALTDGWSRVAIVPASYDRLATGADVHRYISHWIYADRTLADYTRQPLHWSLAVLAVLLCVGWWVTGKQIRIRRYGQRLRGAELVGVDEFNRRSGGDGVGWEHEVAGRNWLMESRKNRWACISREGESSHIMIMGDTGSGRSAAIRYLLAQIHDRGETAIIYDPAMEYLPEFYEPSRNDVILNPLDERSPYWTPTDEVTHPAEALTLATSFLPSQGTENRFFTEAPRRILAYLLNLKPTPDELSYWLAHPEQIDQRVRGTELEVMIDQRTAAQRSGVLASLNMIACILRLLPGQSETKVRWSVAQWSRKREGWIFITSTPTFREMLRPLNSLWLDQLILRLMVDSTTAQKKTWLIIDELASLDNLPQLHAAVTETRKSGNVIVLGFQGRSQVEKRYGPDAESILSQPATKLFLRTIEPNAAEWISRSIGEEERAYLRETMTQNQRSRHSSVSEHTEYRTERLVTASQIASLRPLHGYVELMGTTAAINFPYLRFEARYPRFVERKFTPSDYGSGSKKIGDVTPSDPPPAAGSTQSNRILFE